MKWEFRDHCVDDIREAVWRQLCLFEDPEYAEEMLLKHSQVKIERNNNRKKQASQIGYSIRQAREFFQAASRATHATRPTLLYYGAVSLSRCCCLLKLGGEISDDNLRNRGFERHHGLEFVGPADEGSVAKSPKSFFEQLSCRVRGSIDLDQVTRKSYGNFPAFVGSILPVPFRLEVNETRIPATLARYVSNVGIGGRESVWQPPAGHILVSADLLRRLPDMYSVLRQAGIESSLFPGRFELHKNEAPLSTADGLQRTYILSVDHLTPDAKDSLISRYVTPNGPFAISEEWPQSIVLYKNLTGAPQPDEDLDPFPAVCDDARTQKYFSFDESDWLEEPAADLAILFCLGWLCRYDADLWVRSIKKKSISNVIDAFLDVVDRRLPNLILDQMTTTLNHFHG